MAINSYEIDKSSVRRDTTMKTKIISSVEWALSSDSENENEKKKINAQTARTVFREQVDDSHYERKILISLNTHNRETTAYRDVIFIAHSHIQHGRQRWRLRRRQRWQRHSNSGGTFYSRITYCNHFVFSLLLFFSLLTHKIYIKYSSSLSVPTVDYIDGEKIRTLWLAYIVQWKKKQRRRRRRRRRRGKKRKRNIYIV